MEMSSSDILKTLPDFSDMLNLSEEIKRLSLEKVRVDSELKAAEAEIFRRALTDTSLFVNGKPPSTTYVREAYKFSGINGELIPLRHKLGDITAELDMLKMRLRVYSQMMDVWRTLAANERSSSM